MTWRAFRGMALCDVTSLALCALGRKIATIFSHGLQWYASGSALM